MLVHNFTKGPWFHLMIAILNIYCTCQEKELSRDSMNMIHSPHMPDGKRDTHQAGGPPPPACIAPTNVGELSTPKIFIYASCRRVQYGYLQT
jgi:hypothetical protein